jgi:hypothetical protein
MKRNVFEHILGSGDQIVKKGEYFFRMVGDNKLFMKFLVSPVAIVDCHRVSVDDTMALLFIDIDNEPYLIASLNLNSVGAFYQENEFMFKVFLLVPFFNSFFSFFAIRSI